MILTLEFREEITISAGANVEFPIFSKGLADSKLKSQNIFGFQKTTVLALCG